MNKTIKVITSTMIIILIVMLLWIFLTYYKNNESIDVITYPSGDFSGSTLNLSGDYIKNEENRGIVESIIDKESGDSNIIENQSSENKNPSNEVDIPDIIVDVSIEIDNTSGEQLHGKTQDVSGENIPNIVEKNDNEQLIISSDPATSSQEKQEVLTEIDSALQGLLEAVSKVEGVDEERLNATLNSEVVKP